MKLDAGLAVGGNPHRCAQTVFYFSASTYRTFLKHRGGYRRKAL